jgi:hypothetical protein
MQYYRALELRNDDGIGMGLFHMTITYNGVTTPIGFCADNQCKHLSRVEACDCYRDYCKYKCNGMMAGSEMNTKYGTEISISTS